MTAQLVGATVAGAINYLIFTVGIATMEASEGLVRGTMASTASFAGVKNGPAAMLVACYLLLVVVCARQLDTAPCQRAHKRLAAQPHLLNGLAEAPGMG